MHLINFTIASSIEIGCGDHPLLFDLHNCFDWQSVAYLSDERRVTLLWKRSTGDWVQPNLPLSLAIEFRGVSNFAACQGQAGSPLDEASCLAHVTFTPPGCESNFEGLFEGYRNELEHITFFFTSGFGLKIWADEAELFIEVKASS